jgi:hypothetical protein
MGCRKWLGGNVSETVWEFEHAVECEAPREFAWKYWTNPANWDDPPARFEFDGPFAVGTRVTTILPGQKFQSVIREVAPGSSALIEMDVGGASVQFCWSFSELATERAKIMQEIRLSGEASAALVEPARAMERTVPDGMKRIAERIEQAWRETHSSRG